MPNWCHTDYVIEGPKKDLDKIESALKNPVETKEASIDWVGNILISLGINPDEYSRMRGFLEYWNYESDVISITFEDAWYKTDFDVALKDKFPELNIYYALEEPGMGIYETNDVDGKYFPERFYVDTCINGNYQAGYFTTEEKALKWIEELSGCSNDSDIENFNSRVDSDDFISIYEFDVID